MERAKLLTWLTPAKVKEVIETTAPPTRQPEHLVSLPAPKRGFEDIDKWQAHRLKKMIGFAGQGFATPFTPDQCRAELRKRGVQ